MILIKKWQWMVYVFCMGVIHTAVAQSAVHLLSSPLIGTYTASQIKARFTHTLLRASVQYGVEVRKITYKTVNTDNAAIVASGALLIPVNVKPLGIISYQHGTITQDAEAPSYYNSHSTVYKYATLLASQGFIVVCPDYIGYGSSKNVTHPYEHRQTLASACVDMLKACKEYCDLKKTGGWEKVFLAGYSEGGYATMALQKMLEEQFPDEFRLTASSLGAGAYHKTRFLQYVITQQQSANTSYNRLYVWVLQTYNVLYKLDRKTDYYFKEPYASRIRNGLFQADLNVKLSDTFTEHFKKSIADKTDLPFFNALQDNDIYDWKPSIPTRLYHGDADKLVPFFNSEDAYNAMKKQGGVQVELIKLPGKDHSSAVLEFILGTYLFFRGFATN